MLPKTLAELIQEIETRWPDLKWLVRKVAPGEMHLPPGYYCHIYSHSHDVSFEASGSTPDVAVFSAIIKAEEQQP